MSEPELTGQSTNRDSAIDPPSKNLAAEEGPAPGHETDPIPETEGAAEISAPSDSPPDASAAEPPKRSPAEAFVELNDSVLAMRNELSEVADFSRICRDKLIRQADDYRAEGAGPALDALLRLHALVFRQVTAMDAGNARPHEFTAVLFEAIKGEIESLGVSIVQPQPGDELDSQRMKVLGTVDCPFWRKPDRVAQVNACGFVLVQESGEKVIQKAEVTVYRK